MGYTLYELPLLTGNMGARLLQPDNIIFAPRKEVISIQYSSYSVDCCGVLDCKAIWSPWWYRGVFWNIYITEWL